MITEKFELWCLVELFGHNKIAGLVTEQTIGGSSFIRVDVPAVGETQPFTRFFNGTAIYALNPMEEDTCKAIAERLQAKPIDSWDMSQIIQRAVDSRLAALPEYKEPKNDLLEGEYL